MKKILILLFIASFAGCVAYKPIVPSSNDAARASQKFPGITLADLNQGKSIFETRCNKCHSLKRPFKHTVEEVAEAVPRMAGKAHLDKQQEELVLKYLLTMNGIQGSN